MSSYTARDLAFHEASHAVMSRLMRAGVDRVVISEALQDGTMWGKNSGNPIRDAMIAIAGAVGATIADCSDDAKAMSRADRSFLRDMDDDTVGGVIEKVVEMLGRNWADVETLADALAERKTLTGYEVEQLLKKSPTHHKSLSANVTISPDDSRVVVATINTADVDRDSEVVLPSGMNHDQYAVNPVLLWMHNYDELPVGRCVGMSTDESKITAKFRFAERPDDYPAGQEWKPNTLLSLYRQRVLNSFSVGFVPVTTRAATDADRRAFGQDCRRVIEDWMLLEVSCVTLPSNPYANATGTSSKGQRTRTVTRVIEPPERKTVVCCIIDQPTRPRTIHRHLVLA